MSDKPAPVHDERLNDSDGGVQPVLGLLENHAAVAVEHLVADLLLVSGQAVHELPVLADAAFAEQVAVDLEAAELPQLFLLLRLLSHGDKRVGDHHVGVAQCPDRVVHHLERGVVGLRELGRGRGDAAVELVARGNSNRHVHPVLERGDREVVDDVVGVAHPGQLLGAEVLAREHLPDGQHVADRLQRVEPVAQAVDDGHARVRDQALDVAVRVDPRKDPARHRRDHLGRVQVRLVDAKLDVLRPEKQRVPAKVVDRALRRDPCSRRPLREKQRNGLPQERLWLRHSLAGLDELLVVRSTVDERVQLLLREF